MLSSGGMTQQGASQPLLPPGLLSSSSQLCPDAILETKKISHFSLVKKLPSAEERHFPQPKPLSQRRWVRSFSLCFQDRDQPPCCVLAQHPLHPCPHLQAPATLALFQVLRSKSTVPSRAGASFPSQFLLLPQPRGHILQDTSSDLSTRPASVLGAAISAKPGAPQRQVPGALAALADVDSEPAHCLPQSSTFHRCVLNEWS